MAVKISTEKCFFDKMSQSQGILLVLIICGAGMAFANPQRCDQVRKDLEQVKLQKLGQTVRVLDRPGTGDICGESCCGQDLEKELYKHNQLLAEKYIKDSITKVSSLIETRARKFDDFFREMMNNSKREFHHMFERTYGKIYLQNSDVFSDFFGELETYYKKGTVRLSETMDTFFVILYQRMFTVINAQYTFDDKYLECVSEHMAEMKPFGDVPHKLGIQLRRSFVATRTFYKALVKGAAAADSMLDLKLDEECLREMTRMRFCGICRGENGPGPCNNYCTATMQSCLRYHMEISNVWDGFVEAIDKVGDRLHGPYNIEIVVEPLNIKISEAIMNFQESGAEVSQKIYNKCGKPGLNSRSKRKADYNDRSEDNPGMEIKVKPMKMHGKKKHKKVGEVDENKTTLEKIIEDIKQKVKETKQFWFSLPHQYCNTLSLFRNPNDTTATGSDQCWNGTAHGSYDLPRARPTSVGGNPLVNEPVYILQGLTDKLRKAYQGQEVEMADDTEEPLAGSGSGSGDDGFEPVEEEEEEQGRQDIVFTDDKQIVQEEIYPTQFAPSSTRAPEVVHASGAGRASVSLTRALIQYLLPMVLVWFGGAVSNLL